MILTIALKELKALFASPLAWVVLTLSQAVLALLFLHSLDEYLIRLPQLVSMPNAPGITVVVATSTYFYAAVILIFAVPVLSMRLVAEERRNQTMTLLMSAPLSMADIVLGKFLGIMAFLLVIVLMVSLMPLSLATSTSLDYGLLASLAAGLTLLAASLVAVSLYVSCLTVHPVAAAVGAFFAVLAMCVLGGVAVDGLQERGLHFAAALAQVFSPLKNYQPFGRGLLDSYALACSLLVIALFLALAVRQLDAQRLRG